MGAAFGRVATVAAALGGLRHSQSSCTGKPTCYCCSCHLPPPAAACSKHILRGATFKIRRGEAVGIIGSSGTGKSTTLRLAAGLLEPDRVRALQLLQAAGSASQPAAAAAARCQPVALCMQLWLLHHTPSIHIPHANSEAIRLPWRLDQTFAPNP